MERETLSQLRERWLASLLQRPGAACVAVAALTLGLGSGLLRLDLRTDGAAIHPLDNVTVQQTLADRDTFHDADQAIVLLTSRSSLTGDSSGLRVCSAPWNHCLRSTERGSDRSPRCSIRTRRSRSSTSSRSWITYPAR
jgi:hypothetical protein